MYKYGWTEAAYNFQQDNFGKGGLSGDRVQMSVQDAGGIDDANFLILLSKLFVEFRQQRKLI